MIKKILIAILSLIIFPFYVLLGGIFTRAMTLLRWLNVFGSNRKFIIKTTRLKRGRIYDSNGKVKLKIKIK